MGKITTLTISCRANGSHVSFGRIPWVVFRFAVMLVTLGLALGATPWASAQAPPVGGVVLTDRDAYLLPPPELIAGPVVARSSLSPGSQNLAVLRTTTRVSAENLPSSIRPNPPMPNSEQELIFWDAETRRSVSMWKSEQPSTVVTLSEWLPGKPSLFALIHSLTYIDGQQPVQEWKLLLLSRGLDQARIVPFSAGPYDDVHISLSPLLPLSVLQASSPPGPEQTTSFTIVYASGRLGAKISVPPAGSVSLLWDAAGNPLLASAENEVASPHMRFYSVNLRTGQTQLLPKAPNLYQVRPLETHALPFHLAGSRQDVTLADSTEHIHPIWLESGVKSERPRTLLTADGSDAVLLPDGDGAIYGAHNSLWFVSILKMDKAEFLAARGAKNVAISRGRQIGLAIMMVAQKNGDVLPGPQGIQEKLLPYVGNDSQFEGFSYVYEGGPLKDIEAPEKTVLGYVEGQNGRVIIYTDGRVKWQDTRVPPR